MPVKESLKTTLHRCVALVRQRSKLQHITGVFITDRQRFAAPLAVVPPSFEVRRPHLIGCRRLSSGGNPPRIGCSSHLSLLGQSTVLEHALKTTLTGRLPF